MGESTPRPTGHTSQRAAAWAVKILRRQVSDPSSEQRLWLAVIEKAVREAYGGGPDTREPQEDARAWLASEAFAEVAALAGLHPHWARDVVEKLGSLAAREGDDGARTHSRGAVAPASPQDEMREDLRQRTRKRPTSPVRSGAPHPCAGGAR